MVWNAATRALDVSGLSGDGYLVVERTDSWLVIVIDALGHGAEADIVKKEAIAFVAGTAERPLDKLVGELHAALRRSRGLVMSAVKIAKKGNLLHWVGVGNVEAMLLTNQGTKYVVNTGGVVGYQLRTLRVTQHTFHKGDLLVLHTDGVRSTVVDALRKLSYPVEHVADLLANNWAGDDDALLWVGEL